MKETIYTIPVNEAFDTADGCPFFVRWRGGLKKSGSTMRLARLYDGAGRAGADKLARLLCAPLFDAVGAAQ